VVGEDSRGEQTQESIDLQNGATRTGCERTRRGIEASKQVKLAESGDSAAWSPEQPGSGLRFVERALIAAGGARQLRESVGVGETRGDKADERYTQARRWITAGEPSGLERGARSLRGERSEGRIPGTDAARNKAANFGCARKPLRG